MKFKKYDKYKDSEVEWLGDIPADWNVKRVKDLFILVTDKAPKGNNMQLLSIYTAIGVKPRRDMEQRGNKSVTTDDYWIVKKNDFIVNKLLAWMGAIGLSHYEGVTSPAYDILRKKVSLDERYYEKLFRTRIAQAEFKKNSRGIMEVRLRLYFDKFGAIFVPLQDIITQSAIGDYLDTHIALIDKKIALLKKKKAKYVELKQALINKTVTKGLDQKVELKDSGAEWIGEIPRSWKVKRIKENYDLVTGNSLANKELYMDKSGGIPYVATKDIDISSLQANYDNGIYIPRNDKTFKIAKKYSTLICLEGGSAGKKLTFIDRDVAYVNKLCAIKRKGNSKLDKYVYYFLQSNIFKSQFFSVLNGLIGGVSMSLISNFIIITPPDEEQERIIKYLDSKIEVIDMIGSKIQKQIETLEELQKTLINDVVTGKVKVT